MPALLACTDGSAYAASLYRHTAWAASRLDAPVEVLHVYPAAPSFLIPPVNFMGDPAMGSASLALPELTAVSEEAERKAKEAAQSLLAEAESALRAESVTDITLTALPGVLRDVLEFREKPYDLLLLGKRGESTASAKKALGGQLETVIRQSPVPVLVVSHEFRPVQRFLISFDDSPSAHAALHHVAQTPLLRGLPCDIVMAGDDTDENREALESARLLLQKAGFEVQEFLMEGDPEAVSAWEVAAHHIDLLVMGAYSHSRFLQFFIGSTTSEMIKSCRVPVLVMGGKMPRD